MLEASGGYQVLVFCGLDPTKPLPELQAYIEEKKRRTSCIERKMASLNIRERPSAKSRVQLDHKHPTPSSKIETEEGKPIIENKAAYRRLFYEKLVDLDWTDEKDAAMAVNFRRILARLIQNHVSILLMTCTTVCADEVRDILTSATLVIHEEAARTISWATAMVFGFTPNAIHIMTGDVKQGFPNGNHDDNKFCFAQMSIFDRLLRNGYPRVKLLEHHRSVPQILASYNKTFYNNALQSCVLEAKRPLHQAGLAFFRNRFGISSTSAFLDVPGTTEESFGFNSSQRNP